MADFKVIAIHRTDSDKLIALLEKTEPSPEPYIIAHDWRPGLRDWACGEYFSKAAEAWIRFGDLAGIPIEKRPPKPDCNTAVVQPKAGIGSNIKVKISLKGLEQFDVLSEKASQAAQHLTEVNEQLDSLLEKIKLLKNL